MFKFPTYDPTAIAMLGFGILVALSPPFIFSYSLLPAHVTPNPFAAPEMPCVTLPNLQRSCSS